MFTVSILGVVPDPRHDGMPWIGAHLEEAASQDGPWTPLENVYLAPLDADPANPQPRDFTTELATLEQGWYRLLFFDDDGLEEMLAGPYHNVPDSRAPYLPEVNDVALLLLARTKDNNGQELGYWSGDTRPTYEQVERTIQNAADEVLGDYDRIPTGEATTAARRTVALRAAMDIEAGFFPEQMDTPRSMYPSLETRFNVAQATLTRAVERGEPVDEGGVGRTANMPVYTFPEEYQYEVIMVNGVPVVINSGMIGLGTVW